MNYSLSYTLGNNGRGADPSAARYIAAVRATGATVDSNQVGEINTFYKAAKTGGYYTSLKRLYLPIWGVAAANAIDMIGLTSGTFNGGVTHGAGFVQGDGTTGYFNGGTAASAGVATGSCSLFSLWLDDVISYTGGYGGSPDFGGLQISDTGLQIRGHAPDDNSSFGTVTTGGGIICVSQTSATARALYQRLTAGVSTLNSNTLSATASLAAVDLYYAGGFNSNGVLQATNNRHGLYGIGTGLSGAVVTSFTLALKTLWESCTGLTLP